MSTEQKPVNNELPKQQKPEVKPEQQKNEPQISIKELAARLSFAEDQITDLKYRLNKYDEVLAKLKELTGFDNKPVDMFNMRNRNPDRLPVGGPPRSYHEKNESVKST